MGVPKPGCLQFLHRTLVHPFELFADLSLRSCLAIPAIYRSAQGPGLESAPRVLFECFWAPGSECPKALRKSTPWGTFRPGPLGTPVNGGRDRNSCLFWETAARNTIPRVLFRRRELTEFLSGTR